MFDEMGLLVEGMGRMGCVQNEGVQLVIPHAAKFSALLNWGIRLLKLQEKVSPYSPPHPK